MVHTQCLPSTQCDTGFFTLGILMIDSANLCAFKSGEVMDHSDSRQGPSFSQVLVSILCRMRGLGHSWVLSKCDSPYSRETARSEGVTEAEQASRNWWLSHI